MNNLNHKINVISNDITTMKIQMNNLVKIIKELKNKIDKIKSNPGGTTSQIQH